MKKMNIEKRKKGFKEKRNSFLHPSRRIWKREREVRGPGIRERQVNKEQRKQLMLMRVYFDELLNNKEPQEGEKVENKERSGYTKHIKYWLSPFQAWQVFKRDFDSEHIPTFLSKLTIGYRLRVEEGFEMENANFLQKKEAGTKQLIFWWRVSISMNCRFVDINCLSIVLASVLHSPSSILPALYY